VSSALEDLSRGCCQRKSGCCKSTALKRTVARAHRRVILQTIKRHTNRSLTNLCWVFLGHNRILSPERKRQEIRDGSELYERGTRRRYQRRSLSTRRYEGRRGSWRKWCAGARNTRVHTAASPGPRHSPLPAETDAAGSLRNFIFYITTEARLRRRASELRSAAGDGRRS
jgi:hypothetical protein